MKLKFLMIALAVLLVACTAQQSPAPAAPLPAAPAAPPAAAPTTPAAPEQTGTGAQAVVTGADKIFGTVNKTSALNIDDVQCDKANKKITFRFKNNDDQSRSWQMNAQVGWDAPKDLIAVHIFVNNYEVNAKTQYILNGEKYFGPNWPFSKNCGDVEVLKVGEDVTCTVYPVPLKSATQLTNGNNEIFVNTPTSHHIIQFTCV
jgi:hypothetical protein